MKILKIWEDLYKKIKIFKIYIYILKFKKIGRPLKDLTQRPACQTDLVGQHQHDGQISKLLGYFYFYCQKELVTYDENFH